MKKTNMTKIKQIEHFQTRIHRFNLLMPIGDFHHHHTLYIMYASRFKSPKNLQKPAAGVVGAKETGEVPLKIVQSVPQVAHAGTIQLFVNEALPSQVDVTAELRSMSTNAQGTSAKNLRVLCQGCSW